MKIGISVAIGALLVTSCAKGDDQSKGEAYSSAEVSDVASPDIAPSAAPGVAFAYAYDYRLDDKGISAIQERHAAACEQLGLSRCRITGLKYSIGEDEQVTAMLAVKLNPTIARQFGKQASAVVEAAGGRLVNAEFSGEDEGSAIATATTDRREVETRIAEIEKRIASLSSGDRERATLQSQLDDLRASLAESSKAIAVSQEKLANTPMTFNYYGKGGVPGFRGINPLAESWSTFIASAVTMITVLLQVIGAVLPWALLLLAILLAVRSRFTARVVRWWKPNDAE